MLLRLRVSHMKKPLTLAIQGLSFGAGEMNRTPVLLITNELLINEWGAIHWSKF